MRRREFVAGLGSVAAMASRPVAVGAQQPKRMRHVGVLTGLPENISEVMVGAFARSLESLGWVEGENIRIDHRFAAGNPTLLETSAAQLVGLAPDAILAIPAAAVAALQQQTSTIPIVFQSVPEPVELGFVQRTTFD